MGDWGMACARPSAHGMTPRSICGSCAGEPERPALRGGGKGSGASCCEERGSKVGADDELKPTGFSCPSTTGLGAEAELRAIGLPMTATGLPSVATGGVVCADDSDGVCPTPSNIDSPRLPASKPFMVSPFHRRQNPHEAAFVPVAQSCLLSQDSASGNSPGHPFTGTVLIPPPYPIEPSESSSAFPRFTVLHVLPTN